MGISLAKAGGFIEVLVAQWHILNTMSVGMRLLVNY